MMQQTLIRSHKENHNIWKWLKMSHFWFSILASPTNFQLWVCQKLAKIDYFWHFNQLLSIPNVKVARFALNFECDYLDDFQTLWTRLTRRRFVITGSWAKLPNEIRLRSDSLERVLYFPRAVKKGIDWQNHSRANTIVGERGRIEHGCGTRQK